MRFLVALCFVFLVTSVTISHVFATPEHGCVSSIPPAVSGSLTQPPPAPGLLFINEVLLTPAPHSIWNCSDTGEPSSNTDMWIEIYNPQDQPFDLYSVHATIDSGPNSKPFFLPFGAAIGAHAFLVVFPRTDPFFLNTETSTLRLVIADTTIDQITAPSLGGDQSYARVPDGSNSWQITSQPTIDASNNPVLTVSTPTPQSHHQATEPSTKNKTAKVPPGNNTGTTSATADQTSIVNGTQPTWTALQLPSPTVAPSVQPVASVPTVTLAPQTSDTADVPQKILVTTGAIVLALALFWSQRLLAKRKKETGK
ncbi:MAG TPA: hypothetical protein VFU49_12300 [Ktedonobacteraceae bacterium]|nr:hypothetical protein [Ktedonobacteraceae bacterium]